MAWLVGSEIQGRVFNNRGLRIVRDPLFVRVNRATGGGVSLDNETIPSILADGV